MAKAMHTIFTNRRYLQYRSLFKKTIFVIVFILLYGPVFTIGQESMMPSISYLMLDKLIDSAKKNYPKMKRYQNKVDVSRYDVQKAKLGWFDALTVSYVYNPATQLNTTAPPSVLNGYQTGLYLNIGQIMGKAPLVRVAKKEYDIAVNDLDEYNIMIETSVRDRYYTFIELLTILNLRTKSAEDAEAAQKTLKYKFEKGEETYDNYSKAIVLTLLSVQNKIEAEGKLLRAKNSLEELIGCKLENIK